jgi:hypothetical protein
MRARFSPAAILAATYCAPAVAFGHARLATRPIVAATLQAPSALLLAPASEASDDQENYAGRDALTALAIPRPHRSSLRHAALDSLDRLAGATSDALKIERLALSSRSERKMLAPAMLTALALLLNRRVGVRSAVGLFFTLRLASALLVRRHPDPLELVPAPVASRAALRSMTLALEACGLLSFSALLGACAACAAAELGARALLTSLAQLALWLASDEVALGTRLETLRVSVVAEEAWRRPLRTSRALAEGASALGALVMQRLRSLSAAANRTGDANRTDSAAAAGVDGIGVIASTSASAANASASAANASANALHAVRSEAHGSAVADAAALPDADAAVDAPTPMHASPKGPPAEGEHGRMAEGEHGWMARARRLWPLDGKGARETAASDEAAAASAASAADAAADAAAASAATVGVGAVPIWWADPPSTTAWELRLLTRRAATQAVAHVLLALAATLWASEAAFVCLLALTQRLRLLVLLVLNRMRQKVARAEPSMKEMLSSLPRTTEELTTQVNYQLNLIGLQTEQWMTDTWAAYLRQRQQWMRGAQSKPTKKSAPKGAKGASGGGGGGGGGEGLANALSNWIDERVVTTKSQWVSFQLERSRKQGPKKPATAGNEGDGAAALPAERLGVAPWRPVSRSTFTTPAAAATERKSPASDGASEKHVVSGSTSTHQQPQHDATSAPWWQRSWWGPQQSAAGSGVDGKVQI